MRWFDPLVYLFFTSAGVLALWSIGRNARRLMEILDELPPAKPKEKTR